VDSISSKKPLVLLAKRLEGARTRFRKYFK